MAKYVVNSRLFFARNFILAEKSRLRSSPLLQAAKRYRQWQDDQHRQTDAQGDENNNEL